MPLKTESLIARLIRFERGRAGFRRKIAQVNEARLTKWQFSVFQTLFTLNNLK